MQDKLGKWLHKGYKIWDWRYDTENCKLLHLKRNTMDVYVPSNLSGTRHTPNRCIRRRIDQEVQDQGKICTARDAGLAVKAIESMANPPEKEIVPDSLLGVLRESGCMWMWKSMHSFGNKDWIKCDI